MTSETQRRSWKPTAVSVGVFLVLFGLLVCYLRYAIRPRLLYYQHCPVFLTGVDYLKGFLGRPAGPAEYATLFLDQFTFYPWAASVVIAVVTTLICLCTRGVVVAACGERVHPAVWCFPAVLLLMLHGQYDYKFITSVSLLVALASAAAWVKLPLGPASRRVPLFLIVAVALYYLVGGMVVLFAVVCGVFEFVRRRRVVPGLVCILFAVALPWVFALTSYEIGWVAAHAPLLPFRVGVVLRYSAHLTVPRTPPLQVLSGLMVLRLALFLFFPLAMVASAHRHRLATLRRKIARRPAADTPAAAATSGPAWTVLSLTLFLVVAVVLVSWTHDRVRKKQLRVGGYGQQRNWKGVLVVASSLPPAHHDSYVMHEVAKALYHARRLPDKMFAFPQKAGADGLLLSGLRASLHDAMLLKNSALWLELGAVNYAHRSTQIAHEAYGDRPEILKRLVRIQVLKGHTELARIILRRLKRNPVHRTWAEDCLGRLDDGSLGESDEVLRLASSWMLTPAVGLTRLTAPEGRLERLLAEHKDNRMAFEYLMAYHLLRSAWLAKSLDMAVENLGRLDDFRDETGGGPYYRDIPRHYSEAMIVRESEGKRLPAALAHRKLDEKARARFADFQTRLARFKSAGPDGKAEAYRALASGYYTSYFFYKEFHYSVVPALETVGAVDAATGATQLMRQP